MPPEDHCSCLRGTYRLHAPPLERGSLTFEFSLHERPISGTGSVDLVIYAAQLSQSFFSCLAGSVEGFLDLFLVHSDLASPTSNNNGGRSDDRSFGESASMLSAASRNVPPGALASIVLWCDSELSKFSSAFSGNRILGNLALSPRPRQEVHSGSKARTVGLEEENSSTNKERTTAIETAAQCVTQALQYASENLDSIGLPLTPRLAEYLRYVHAVTIVSLLSLWLTISFICYHNQVPPQGL